MRESIREWLQLAILQEANEFVSILNKKLLLGISAIGYLLKDHWTLLSMIEIDAAYISHIRSCR